jgi:two-component system NarL family sensor kinase
MAQEIFSTIALVTIFFILLIAIIIIIAISYHSNKRIHKIELDNFQNILLQSQMEVQEQTMQTIGADLHDNIGQLLSLTSLTLGSIEVDDQAKAKEKINAAINLTGRSIKEMRQLGKLLQGEQLIEAGLYGAIRSEIDWVEKSGQYQIICVLEEEMPATHNPDKDLIIFRILQEALNNIMKHARATEVVIKLSYLDQKLQLYIEDNGVGFDIESSDHLPGMGLQNIQRRVAIVGGEVEIKSQPGAGTRLTIFIPYP